MHFLGKKTWVQSLIFWAVILIIGVGLSMANIGILASLAGILVFILLAHYWYHLSWIWSVVVWAVAWVIDMIIIYIIVIMLLSTTLPSGLPGVLW